MVTRCCWVNDADIRCDQTATEEWQPTIWLCHQHRAFAYGLTIGDYGLQVVHLPPQGGKAEQLIAARPELTEEP